MSNADSVLPYNPTNVLLIKEHVTSILKLCDIDCEINDLNLYRKSFVHKSYCTRKNENFLNGNTMCPANCIPLQEESNERLEFLGDSVINLVVASYLFERYPDENEGFLTKMRTKLVNGIMLAHFGKIIGLSKYVLISKQIEDNNGRDNKKILEDCFESFVGAMYIDFKSFKVVQTWFINLIENNIDFSELIATNHNHKDVLLKYFQHNFHCIPRFLEVNTEHVNNVKLFTVCIKDKNDAVICTGIGATKKIAENDASKNALRYYGVSE